MSHLFMRPIYHALHLNKVFFNWSCANKLQHVSTGKKPTLKILGVVFRVEELPNGQVGPDEVVLQHDVDPSLQRRLSARDEVAIWK